MNVAHVAELAAEELAQESELGPRESRVRGDDPLDELDLEDRVREAWAGPSWISWASRDRSASWASTIRIATSASVAGGVRSANIGSSPRSRKRRDRSKVRSARSSGQLGLVVGRAPDEPVDLLAQGPRPGRSSIADRRGRDRDRRHAGSRRRRRRLGGCGRPRAARGRREGSASARASRRTPPGSAPGCAAASSRPRRPRRSPPRGDRRSGHRRACASERAASMDFGVYGSSLMDRRPRTLERPRADRVRRRRGRAEVDLAEAVSALGRRCRGPPATGRGSPPASTSKACPGTPGRGPGRATSAGGSSGRARAGIRWLSASQIGKSRDDRAGGRVERVAGKRHPLGRAPRRARPSRALLAERRQQRDGEQRRPEDRRAAPRARPPAGSSPAGRRAARSRRRGPAAPR